MAPKHDLVETEVAVRCPAGHPLVLRCHPLLRERVQPFPTLFWLVCDVVGAQIAKLEYDGDHRLPVTLPLNSAGTTSYRSDATSPAAARSRWAPPAGR